MRYIHLTASEVTYLETSHRRGSNQIERRRSQCLLLSSQGYCLKELVSIFNVRYATVLDWFNSWERLGRESIPIQGRRGRKSKFAGLDQRLVTDGVQQYNRNLKAAVACLEKELGIKVSKRTLPRFLKTGPLHLPPDTPQP
jgi:transposase